MDKDLITIVACKDRLPTESGVYPAFASSPDRTPPENWMQTLYSFDAESAPDLCPWQHITGFFDNGITHWVELNSK